MFCHDNISLSVLRYEHRSLVWFEAEARRIINHSQFKITEQVRRRDKATASQHRQPKTIETIYSLNTAHFQSAIEKVFCLLFPTITGANKKWKPRGWQTRAEDSFMFSVDSIQRIKNSFPWRIRRNRLRYAFSFARPTSGDCDLRFELDTLLLLIVIPL